MVAGTAVLAMLLFPAHAMKLRSMPQQHGDVLLEEDFASSRGGATAQVLNGRFAAAVDAGIEGLLEGNSHKEELQIDGIIKAGVAAMDLDSALGVSRVPKQVAKLLNFGQKSMTTTDQTPSGDPKDVQKSIATLNDMILKAQQKLDSKSLQCRTFKEKNQETLDHIQTDLSRLGGSLANLERTKISTLGKKWTMGGTIQALLDEQKAAKQAYLSARVEAEANIAKAQARVRSSEYMLGVTRCPPSLLQGARGKAASLSIQLCEGQNGTKSYRFYDPHVQKSVSELSSQGDDLINFVLSRTQRIPADVANPEALQATALAFGETMDEREDGDADGDQIRSPLSVLQGQDEGKHTNRCMSVSTDCGIVYDNFALLWGGMKDQLDTLVQQMADADVEWKRINADLNAQITTQTASIGELSTLYAEATSQAIAEGQAQRAKQQEQARLRKLYEETMKQCKESIRTILFTDICGTMKVRNQLAVSRLGVSEMDIRDCSVTPWADGACSVPCSEGAVGGIKLLSREVVAESSQYGSACPALNASVRCNQVECPVDCVLSDWSQFSKCSKECGGGVQTRTRSKVQSPKFGGHTCESLQEMQPCNTGSCDQDCILAPWTRFSACSQACDGGSMTKSRRVSVEKRAAGECPSPKSSKRFIRNSCNLQRCIGDEVCVKEMDMVVAIDSSGSLSQRGFDAIKSFTSKLIDKYRENARMAIVQFGNGHLNDHKVVSDAVLSLPFSNSMTEVNFTVNTLTWQRGFTNMAQGVKRAGELLKRSSRRGAEPQLLLITDGKPCFRRQTRAAVDELKAVANIVVVHVKENPKPDDVQLMKSYASSPSSDNYVHIPGKKSLRENPDTWAHKVLIRSCPFAVSVSVNLTLQEPGLTR